MDKKEGSSTNFMPDDLLEVICILERGKKHNSYKIYVRGIIFLSSPNFPPRMENRRYCRTVLSLQEQQPIRIRENFQPTTSYQIKGESVEGTNLHMLLDLQVIIRIRNLKILPIFG